MSDDVFERKLLVTRMIQEHIIDVLQSDYKKICIDIEDTKNLIENNKNDKVFKVELLKLTNRKKELERKLKNQKQKT